MIRTLATVTDVVSRPPGKHGDAVRLEVFIVCSWVRPCDTADSRSAQTSVLCISMCQIEDHPETY